MPFFELNPSPRAAISRRIGLSVVFISLAIGCGGSDSPTEPTAPFIAPEQPNAPTQPERFVDAPIEPIIRIERGTAFALQSHLNLPLKLDRLADILDAFVEDPMAYLMDKILADHLGPFQILLAPWLNLHRINIHAELSDAIGDDVNYDDLLAKIVSIADTIRRVNAVETESLLRLSQPVTNLQPGRAKHSLTNLTVSLDGGETRLAINLPAAITANHAVTTLSIDPPATLFISDHLFTVPVDEAILLNVVADVLGGDSGKSLQDILDEVVDCSRFGGKVGSYLTRQSSLLADLIPDMDQQFLLGCRVAISAIPELIEDLLDENLEDGDLRSSIHIEGSALMTVNQGQVNRLEDGIWSDLGTFVGLRLREASGGGVN